MLSKFTHPEKLPIAFTPLGIVIFLKFVELLNALLWIFITLAGIEYSDAVSDRKNYPDKTGVTFANNQYRKETNLLSLSDSLGRPYTNPIQ